MSIKTRAAKKTEISEKWFVVDASNQKIGRLSTKIAGLLMGKNDPVIASAAHLTPKNKVVVINADKLYIPFKKLDDKVYTRYSGYPGGLKRIPLRRMYEDFPGRVIEKAVRGMLPKGSRGRAIYTNLKVYSGSEHKHTAQQLEPVKV